MMMLILISIHILVKEIDYILMMILIVKKKLSYIISNTDDEYQ